MPSPLDQPECSTPSQTSPDDAPPAQPLAIEYNKAAGQDERGPSNVEEGEEPVQKLDLGEGNIIKLDKLGPMIINSDGTLSRIQNWQDLHPIEQERTVRLLVKKRNLVRLRKLDEAGGAEKGEEGKGERLSALKEGMEGDVEVKGGE